MTNEKVIPKDVWKKFVDEYWNEVEYKDLTSKSIKEYLGKYLFVALPKDVTDEVQMEPWYKAMKELREKGKAFGGYTIDLSKDTTPLNKLFLKPMNPAEMNKILWDYIKAKKDNAEKPDNKKIVVVHSPEELEKAAEKIKPKKEK